MGGAVSRLCRKVVGMAALGSSVHGMTFCLSFMLCLLLNMPNWADGSVPSCRLMSQLLGWSLVVNMEKSQT